MNNDAQIAKRMAHAVTRVTKTVFPGRTNHHNTLFGGEALAWMDEAAFIAATRFCRKPLVTVSSDRVDFKESIPHTDSYCWVYNLDDKLWEKINFDDIESIIDQDSFLDAEPKLLN
jgi:hypothetical protein